MKKDTNAELAKIFISRAAAQGMKGKARDRAAVEFFVGAAAYTSVVYGADSKEWSAASIAAFMVGTGRGYEEVEKLAKGKDA